MFDIFSYNGVADEMKRFAQRFDDGKRILDPYGVFMVFFFVDDPVELQEVRELCIVEPEGGIASVCPSARLYHLLCTQASDNLTIIMAA